MKQNIDAPSYEIVFAAKVVWNYMKLGQKIQPSELIFVLGSRDDRVAQYAAELYAKDFGKRILISGGAAHANDLLAVMWSEKTEAAHFASILHTHGVPASAILLEEKAQNTGQNIMLGYEALQLRGLQPKSMILVQKPYMERRTYAAFMKQWSHANEMKFYVTSPHIEFEDYFDNRQPFEVVVNIMVGDLQRIIEYPKLGFQISQKVPREVYNAWCFLVNSGYNKHLLQQ